MESRRTFRRLSAFGSPPSSRCSLDGVALTALIRLRQNHPRPFEPLSIPAKPADFAPRHEAPEHLRVRQPHAITSADSVSHVILASWRRTREDIPSPTHPCRGVSYRMRLLVLSCLGEKARKLLRSFVL